MGCEVQRCNPRGTIRHEVKRLETNKEKERREKVRQEKQRATHKKNEERSRREEPGPASQLGGSARRPKTLAVTVPLEMCECVLGGVQGVRTLRAFSVVSGFFRAVHSTLYVQGFSGRQR